MPSPRIVDIEEVHRNRETDPPVPFRVMADWYGMKESTLRGKYYRWLRTQEGETAPGYVPPPPAFVAGEPAVIVSRPDNTFLFGVAGDRHHASKYHRNDVLCDLHERFERAGVDYVLDTGNWIDGDARINKHDLVRIGLDPQMELMAQETPHIGVPTLAIWGACHEGWYAAREGIDVGAHAEMVMRSHGHDWTNLGFLESHLILRNYNTGNETIMSVMHPGGGSAYATSYRPQKIVESLEGGEKPALIVMGHYHKLEALNIRNVWVLQAGCCCDQTPFMRQRSIEAHVGGVILGLEQEPGSGALIGFTPQIMRYFNRGFYNSRWNRAGSINPAERTV